MRLRSILLIIVVALVGVFAALNWAAFNAVTELSLGFTTIQAPLGLIMLGIAGMLLILFLLYALYLQTTYLMESRRYSKELEASRELADKAEGSRFNELRNFLDAEMQRRDQLLAEHRNAFMTRMDTLEQQMQHSVENAGNGLSAMFGELEDRIERRFNV